MAVGLMKGFDGDSGEHEGDNDDGDPNEGVLAVHPRRYHVLLRRPLRAAAAAAASVASGAAASVALQVDQ